MIRYKKLGRTELNVTDLERSRNFYEQVIGLQLVCADSKSVYFRCDQDNHNVVLHQSNKSGLRLAGFMLEDDLQFEHLIRKLCKAGIDIHEVDYVTLSRNYQARAIRIFEPRIGAVIEFYVPQIDQERPFVPTVAKIQRIGHVVFNTPNYVEAVKFWRNILNFKISDSIGESITFMRCWPSPWHHGIGISQASQYSLHHVNFMVTEIDDVGRALARLRKSMAPVVFGPGRHPASNSVFLYFLDPDGLTMEYSFGMEEFTEEFPREARLLPLSPKWLDTWSSEYDSRAFQGASENSTSVREAL